MLIQHKTFYNIHAGLEVKDVIRSRSTLIPFSLSLYNIVQIYCYNNINCVWIIFKIIYKLRESTYIQSSLYFINYAFVWAALINPVWFMNFI